MVSDCHLSGVLGSKMKGNSDEPGFNTIIASAKAITVFIDGELLDEWQAEYEQKEITTN
jgi:hypothetical protein